MTKQGKEAFLQQLGGPEFLNYMRIMILMKGPFNFNFNLVASVVNESTVEI